MQSKKYISNYLSNMDALNSDKLDSIYNPLGYSNFNNKNFGFINKNNKRRRLKYSNADALEDYGVIKSYFDDLADKRTEYNLAKSKRDAYYANEYTPAKAWYDHLVSIEAWNTHKVEWADAYSRIENGIFPKMAELDNDLSNAKKQYDELNDFKWNDALAFYKEGVREKDAGISELGKLDWIDLNVKNSTLRDLFKKIYLRGRKEDISKLDESEYNKVKDYYNEGIREQKAGISEIGKIGWVKENVPSNKELYIIWYLKGREDGSLNLFNFPNRIIEPAVIQPVPSAEPAVIQLFPSAQPAVTETTTSEDAESTSKETTSKNEKSDKILGLNKNVAIIGGIAILALGAILIIRKNK